MECLRVPVFCSKWTRAWRTSTLFSLKTGSLQILADFRASREIHHNCQIWWARLLLSPHPELWAYSEFLWSTGNRLLEPSLGKRHLFWTGIWTLDVGRPRWQAWFYQLQWVPKCWPNNCSHTIEFGTGSKIDRFSGGMVQKCRLGWSDFLFWKYRKSCPLK